VVNVAGVVKNASGRNRPDQETPHKPMCLAPPDALDLRGPPVTLLRDVALPEPTASLLVNDDSIGVLGRNFGVHRSVLLY